MRARDLHLSLADQAPGPLYLQVAGSLIQAIIDGRVAPGVALPGIRELAERLGVHRNTVVAALRELEAQGWVETRPRTGCFVVEEPPTGRASGGDSSHPAPTRLGFDLPSRLQPLTDAKDLRWDLSDGVADARLAPTEALARAYQRALRLKGPQLLGSGEFKGLRRLREALVAHLSQHRALRVDPDQLLLIRSTSMAISLVTQALLGPEGGDVAVENPGHPMAWETLRQVSAARLHGVAVDQEGLRPDHLEQLLARFPIALLLVTPQCHYPTGVALSAPRRLQLLELARRHRFAILELDPEFDYLQGTVPAPLASQDTDGTVLYVGSLARTFGPGLRLGYLAVPGPLADGFAKARQRLDWQGESVLEWAISELILDGELERHLRRVRHAAMERRECLEDALRHGLSERVAFMPEQGGMGVWLQGVGKYEDPLRFDLWIRSLATKGLKLRTGSYFQLLGDPMAATRLGFTAHQPEELQQAVAWMA